MSDTITEEQIDALTIGELKENIAVLESYLRRKQEKEKIER